MKSWPKAIMGLLLAWTAACAPGVSSVTPGVTSVPLPAEVTYPEGIAYDPGRRQFYTASAADGTVARTDLGSGRSELLLAPGVLMPASGGPFPGPLGMKLDAAGRLWIGGGLTGQAFVIDTTAGTLTKRLDTRREGSLLNDLVFTPAAAFFTDTLNPMLWRVPINDGAIGDLEPWLDLSNSPIEYGEGPNLNGIAATPDGRTLVVVQMNKGLLYRVDVPSRAVTPIPLEGGDISGGDGLVLDGSTLYLVRQPHAEIATIRLSPDLSSGRVVQRFSDPALQWPATAALTGEELLVVNSQFNRRDASDPNTPFAVTRVPISALQGD